MRRWELWVGEGTHSFFPQGNEQARRLAQEESLVLCWEVIAKGHNPAMRPMHQYCCLGEYTPMLNEDGEPFPEDEDDNHVRPMRQVRVGRSARDRVPPGSGLPFRHREAPF